VSQAQKGKLAVNEKKQHSTGGELGRNAKKQVQRLYYKEGLKKGGVLKKTRRRTEGKISYQGYGGQCHEKWPERRLRRKDKERSKKSSAKAARMTKTRARRKEGRRRA